MTFFGADTVGVLYTYAQGTLFWRRHDATGSWVHASGSMIGSGFDEFAMHGLNFLGDGTLYVVRPTPPELAAAGELLEFRVTNYADIGSGASWCNDRKPASVGTGWTIEPHAAPQGYALNGSVAQG